MVGAVRSQPGLGRPWSVSAQAKRLSLGSELIRSYRDYQRQELNERVVFLRCNTFIIALAQALIHLYYDYSYVPVPLPTLSSVGDVKGIARSKSRELSVSDQLKTKAWKMAVQIPISAVVLSCASLVTYIFIRPTAWSWSLSCARIVWDVADEPYPPVLPPYHYTVLGRTLQQSFLLITLWETCNTFFTLFVGQAPIKRGQVLTADSKDPNGSLITGLMARKDAVKTFALWELNIIVERFDARRKSILIELDRNGGSAWTQVFSECLDTINAINLRITEHQDPGSTIAAAHIAAPVAQPKIQTLLRIASPLREGQILTQSKPQDQFERYTQPAGSMMKSIGQAPPSQQFDLSPKVQRYFGKARDKVLSPEQQRAISKTNIHSSYQRHMAQLLRFKLNPLLPAYLNEHIPHLQPGLLFQETFARRMNCIVFGSPRGDLQILLYAIDVLVALSFASLTEDKYGVVSKDLPTIFRTLTATISNIEALLMSTPPHWTDVDFKDADGKGRKVKEIGTLLHHLKVGLTKLLGGFGGFASSLDLGPVDLRDARRAAGIEKA